MTKTILVTGATGFIGRWLVRDLTAKGYTMLATMRRPQQQMQALGNWLRDHGGNPDLLQPVQADLAAAGWGLNAVDQLALQKVDVIYHLASRFDWHLDTDDARRANVASLQPLLALVDANPGLQRLVWVGGYMVGNPHTQMALQQLSQGQWQGVYHRLGAYEASKLESYVVLKALLAQRSVPWTFVHPSTVVGDSVSGEITQDIGLLTLVDALQKGRLTAVPGKRTDWLPLIPVDYLAQFLAGVITQDDAVQQEYWLLDDATPMLPELIRWLAEGLGKKAPRMQIPVGLMKFILNAGLGKRWDMAAESLNFIDSARYDTAPAQALAQQMGLIMPPVRTTVDRMVAYWREEQGLA